MRPSKTRPERCSSHQGRSLKKKNRPIWDHFTTLLQAPLTSQQDWNPKNPPTTTASMPLIKEFNWFSSWSSVEAGPACFSRVATMPSIRVGKERRKPSGVISSFQSTPTQAQMTLTCASGAIVVARHFSISEQLQCRVSGDSVFTADLTVGCAVHLGVVKNRVRANSMRGSGVKAPHVHSLNTQRHKHAGVIPWPVEQFPSVSWQPSRIQVLVVYSGHTYKTHKDIYTTYFIYIKAKSAYYETVPS